MRALPPPRAWLVIAIFLALAVSAFAEFSVTYTGPVCTVTAPNGQQTQVPATVTPDGWISVGAQSYYPGTKFEINGTIRATLTWIGTGTGPDPQQMILQEDSEATYTSTSGAASNGLGDPCIVSSGGGSSQGSAWNVFTNDGVYTIRRRVSVRGEITASSGFGGVWLRYRVTPTPILPVVQGAVWHDNQFKCLPGHKLILSVNTGTYAQTGHNWTPPGTDLVFKGIAMPSGEQPQSRSVVPLQSPTDTQSSSLGFFVSSPGAATTSQVTLQVVTPEGPLPANASTTVMVGNLSGSNENPIFGTSYAGQLGLAVEFGTSGNNTEGIDFTFVKLINLQIPYLFDEPGTWFFSQLINSVVTIDLDVVPELTTTGFELDNYYIYKFQNPKESTPAINTTRRVWDSPSKKIGLALLVNKSEVKIDFLAKLYGLFLPPSNGVGRIAVPVAKAEWDWIVTYRLVGGQWIVFQNDPQAPSLGPKISSPWTVGNFNSDYTWQNVFTNSY